MALRQLLSILCLFFCCLGGFIGLALPPRSCGWHGGKGTRRGPLREAWQAAVAIKIRILSEVAGGDPKWPQLTFQGRGRFVDFSFWQHAGRRLTQAFQSRAPAIP